MGLTLGTNCGFVTTAPTADPGGSSIQMDWNSYTVKDTSPANVIKITEIGWWCSTANAEANFQVGLYASDGETVPGEAGTRLYVDDTNAKGTTAGWKRVTVDWDIDEETIYWIGVSMVKTTPSTYTKYATSGGAGYDWKFFATTLPDPYGGGSLTDSDGMVAFYALVEVESSGTNTQVNIGDTWKDIDAVQVNIGDTWKEVAGIQVNIGDTWKEVF